MSTESIAMLALLKAQETQRQALAASAYEAWQPIKEKEVALLKQFDGKFPNATKDVQDEIIKGREKYSEEWGADGKLAALMDKRHTKEREKLVMQETITKQLNEKGDRGRDR
ncbi:hypothetical protein [Chitinophaga pinensis]|uniref:Uncharacterized protein n=1 Tax=Chitinophaga pinensis (strain ATCC 43595 / DSM 2588 / LMG 13176 / NBRC 15968 / NCIMB 11800 / UQM 2034) TaxID=485918 RepID=A0A979GZ79_CHIPD|nr:hypothetical protein [Chitinophaga pinensis]ACU63726.1 hypothetical protein Cpin_6321 [Chitinophaga pinensis DSM 2588]